MENSKMEVFARYPKEYGGWTETKLSKTVMSRLWSYIETAKKDPVSNNANLAGNISKSLILEDKDNWFFKNTLKTLINHFVECFPVYTNGLGVATDGNSHAWAAPFHLESLWVNFQKENEFNPLHHHGGIFSFVIWMKIPTDWREQHALPISANSNTPKASDFEFQFTSMLGNFEKHAYFLDKKAEGQMLFFPARLNHLVYPFYNCDKERISISGNIWFDISENAMKQFHSQRRKYSYDG